VDLTHLVNAPRIEQDPFGNGGLTGVNMGDDTNISGFREFMCRYHEYFAPLNKNPVNPAQRLPLKTLTWTLNLRYLSCPVKEDT
jgi:hypothetical protein